MELGANTSSRIGALALVLVGACRTGGPPPATASVSASSPDAVAEPNTLGQAQQTPAARQFAAWLAAFNSGDRARLLAYHERNCPYSVASVNVGTIDQELYASHQGGGLDVRTTEGSPTEITVTMKARLVPAFVRARMRVDAAEPHRVLRLVVFLTPSPDELQSPAEQAANHPDAVKRHRLLDAVKQNIRVHYVLPEVGDEMIRALDEHDSHGVYDGAADGVELAGLVSNDLYAASHDRHIGLSFGPRQLAPSHEQSVAELRATNFGFGSIRRLPGNIAHMVINGFPNAGPEADEGIAGFMTQIADADALLLDLRSNHGGDPHTVQVVASYLFDASAPVHLNDIFLRDTGATEEFWTRRDLKGTRFGSKKPVYVLASHQTFSGAEELAYDLQVLKRGVIVGEATAGGANPSHDYDLDDWYHFSVPSGRAINPVTKTNWEGIGVTPDVPVDADSALDEALRRASRDLAARKRSDKSK